MTASELMRGTLEVVKRNEGAGKLVRGYEVLTKLLDNLVRFQILPFDEEAEKIYRAMSPQTKRLGTKDCQLAATALALNFTVITRNTRDFQRTPNVKFADWTSNG
ncbi:MAG: type II toxin-antitoxin system VapC family toxin [Acidobacteria bacterium]|nr:type II toxin-antitoxin system VapC family toxin [Acidobacteriota bacterium]